MYQSNWIPVDVETLRKSTIRGGTSAMLNDVPTEFQVQVSDLTASLFLHYIIDDEPVEHLQINDDIVASLGRHSFRLYSLEVRLPDGPENAVDALKYGMREFVEKLRGRKRYKYRADNFAMAGKVAREKAYVAVEGFAH